MKRVLECVPNFSEGRDRSVIDRIAAAAAGVAGVELLDVDPGAATHRTVVTLAGEPEAVVEAAVRAGKEAASLIDMTRHSGQHPRFGAMDVCPLVPVSGITMEETVELARELGRRLGEEAGLSVYLYEEAATRPERRNLAQVRAGEYEGLAERMKDPAHAPDFGPTEFQPRTGATAVSARNFLAAFNVNLNTTSTRRANAVAFDVREKGRIQREGHPLTGPVVQDADGNPVWMPGSLATVKGIGWFIKEYGICQVSLNLTDLSQVSLHQAFDEVEAKARDRGIRATGSELVGLVPRSVMLDAGRHYLRRQQRSTGVSDRELIHIAVRSMGLDELGPFREEEKLVESALEARKRGSGPAASAAEGRGASPKPKLVEKTLQDFVWETASESPAPGGGSAAAAAGALGAALATMVANLSSHKQGWDDRWEEFSKHAEQGKACHDRLLSLVDEDTAAFDSIMASWRLPAGDDDEKAAKDKAVQVAVRNAIEVPLHIMEVALEAMSTALPMAESGLKASASDAGVAALCARAAVLGAGLNVRINAPDLEDAPLRDSFLAKASELTTCAETLEKQILEAVDARLAEGNGD